jgi:hypothetical protein
MAVWPFVNVTQLEQAQASKEATINEMARRFDLGAGFLQKSIAAGGTINLSEDESLYGYIDLTGAPGSATDVTQLAAVTKATWFRNSTTGGQVIRVRIGAGTFFTIPAGGTLLLLSTANAIRLHSDTAPLREGVAAAGTSSELSRADHVHPGGDEIILLNTDLVTLTNIPAALTEFNGQTHRRVKANLAGYSQARVTTRVDNAGAAPAGSEVRVQYSTDESAWNYLDHTAGPASNLDAAGTNTDGYVTLNAGAKADVFLRAVTINGDGAGDPVVGYVALQLK